MQRCLVVTECSSRVPKEKFYWELPQSVHSADIMDFAGDFNTHRGQLGEAGWQNQVVLFVLGSRIENGDRLIQFCSDNSLFLANMNFRRKNWRPPLPSRPWHQIDETAIGHRWHE